MSGTSVEDLYVRTAPRLIGLLTTITGSRADGEEIVQDAYVQLLSNWSRVRHYEDPEAWTRTVAVRLALSRLRRRKVALRGLLRLASEHASTPAEPDPERMAAANALSQLPVDQRAVVVLHYFNDLPVEAIAKTLRIPTGTVKSRLSRARSTLGELLDDNLKESRHA